ncbi:response regulator transcription factor [Stagnihabitans tardus]|uniref:Response regulator n=1 Tax=Stagnihabitans tardus TaxID=2699202 RepID=A0AAE4YD33_9RHOB|nr:response regulator [Stagnihabitans tardus]NBZ87745.1 response regulator [Stagnihabitans tardus]
MPPALPPDPAPTAPPGGISLLIVEDDPRLAETLARSFTARGYAVTRAASVEAAREAITGFTPARAIVDLKLAEGSGLEVVALLAALEPAPRIVVLTGFASIATTVEAIKLGATQYLAKPASAREIEAAFDHEAGREMPDIAAPRVSALRTQEWETIQRTLADTEFNISEAARRLGMHRRTLARKLVKQPMK